MTETLPMVSVVTPTLNAAHVLEECLASIRAQDYPPEQVELIVADGGSTDATAEIAERFGARVIPNPLKTGEAGKAIGVRSAQGEIIALVDSDNILPHANWLRRMVAPFADPEIAGTEPISYTRRQEDGPITRYCALLGMNDPLCLFLGNYDRWCALTQRWTEMPVQEEDRGDYLKVTLDPRHLPTMGANGFLIRRSRLAQCEIGDYLFDTDVIYTLSQQGYATYAKVKLGIVHIFSGNWQTFWRKQRRRVQDYVYFKSRNVRRYPWGKLDRWRLLKFIIYCLTGFPLVAQSIIGYLRQPDGAWFFHPLACWTTLWVYAWGTVRGALVTKPESRRQWRQS
ncbi:MAG: glycosyltransferase family 2 protein [Anaerolineae bacterium]|nr:glycosyltransferase family 2 protein [Anaerolineae bacterium]